MGLANQAFAGRRITREPGKRQDASDAAHIALRLKRTPLIDLPYFAFPLRFGVFAVEVEKLIRLNIHRIVTH